MRDRPAKALFRTGHRTRTSKRVLNAVWDLLLMQSSDVPTIRRQSRALLSLILRETASLRASQRDWESRHGLLLKEERKKERQAKVQVARQKLDLELDAAPPPTLGTKFDEITQKESRELQDRYEEEKRLKR